MRRGVAARDFYLGQAIVRYGECCEHEVAFLKQLLFRTGRFVEVGANAGLLTLPIARALAQRGESLDAFEPQAFLFQNLCANLALNGLGNVRAWPFACGEEAGVVPAFPPSTIRDRETSARCPCRTAHLQRPAEQ